LFRNKGVDKEFEYLLHWWEELFQRWPADRYRALPAGLIHGDYHGRNVVFDDDRLKGIFDFDVMTWGARAFDLSSGLLRFGRERRGSRRIRPVVGHIFLDEYSRHRSITREEHLAIGAFLAFAPDAAWFEYRQRDMGEDPAQLLRDWVRGNQELEAELAPLVREFGWDT
jgi:Ser/Thr protein kinase RdoA (MazF antagonist)